MLYCAYYRMQYLESVMDIFELMEEVNQKLSNFLRIQRRSKGESVAQIGQALGLSEWKLRKIEKSPINVPAYRLYNLIRYYGPSALDRAEDLFLEIQVKASQIRAAF